MLFCAVTLCMLQHMSLQDVVDVAVELGGDNHGFKAVQLPINLYMREAWEQPWQLVRKEQNPPGWHRKLGHAQRRKLMQVRAIMGGRGEGAGENEGGMSNQQGAFR